MAEQARSTVAVRAFQGFSTDADPNDRPPGLAAESVNAESHDPGVLRSRPGYRVLSFEGE